jgi:hypothetical protein
VLDVAGASRPDDPPGRKSTIVPYATIVAFRPGGEGSFNVRAHRSFVRRNIGEREGVAAARRRNQQARDVRVPGLL